MRNLEVEKKKKKSLPFLQEKRQLETSLSEEKQGVIDSPEPDDDEKTTSMTVVQMQTLMPMRTHIDDEMLIGRTSEHAPPLPMPCSASETKETASEEGTGVRMI